MYSFLYVHTTKSFSSWVFSLVIASFNKKKETLTMSLLMFLCITLNKRTKAVTVVTCHKKSVKWRLVLKVIRITKIRIENKTISPHVEFKCKSILFQRQIEFKLMIGMKKPKSKILKEVRDNFFGRIGCYILCMWLHNNKINNRFLPKKKLYPLWILLAMPIEVVPLGAGKISNTWQN